MVGLKGKKGKKIKLASKPLVSHKRSVVTDCFFFSKFQVGLPSLVSEIDVGIESDVGKSVQRRDGGCYLPALFCLDKSVWLVND